VLFAIGWVLLLAIPGACTGNEAGGRGADSAEGMGGLVGNPAPDFSVAPLAGPRGTISLKALHGGVVVLDFWGTFCEPCKKSFPKLQELYAKYGSQGVHVVAISEDEPDDRDKIPAFAASYGAKFAVGWDENKALAHRYGPETMPSTFVIDKRGIVRFVHAGFHDGDATQIEKEIQQLLER
jgi:cytochrome c biogenesis protein CcmG, thiol:disulfide interchange protein DsbE